MDTTRIRPIAICLFRRGNRILVSEGFDTIKQNYYYRPLGGGIEYGESSRETVAREIREELGVEIENLRLFGVLENIFIYEGRQGHEIVFVFDAEFANKSLDELEEIDGYEQEADVRFKASWKSLNEIEASGGKLVPKDLATMLRRQDAVLIEPDANLATEFSAMAKEYEAAGDDRYHSALENFPGYLERILNYARGVNLNSDRVPANEFWLIAGGKIVGRSTLRHRLNSALRREGGHIGYDVRPSARRKGYGALILELTLEKAKDLKLKKVFLTCDTDNIGSAKIIEKNGGKLAGRAISEKSEKQISRYWIELR